MTSIAAEANQMLVGLATAHHRGPHDTWGAARDRAAKAAGIEPSYAKRIWNRWQDMSDVSGNAYRSLKRAYDAQCERQEAARDFYNQRTEDLRNGRQDHAVSAGSHGGMAPLPHRMAETSSPPLSRT